MWTEKFSDQVKMPCGDAFVEHFTRLLNLPSAHIPITHMSTMLWNI